MCSDWLPDKKYNATAREYGKNAIGKIERSAHIGTADNIYRSYSLLYSAGGLD